MTNTDHRIAAHYQSPAAIRDETFHRRMMGLEADKVYEYLDLLADQVQATERELGESRAEVEQLRAQLQRLQGELDEYEQMGDRVNEQVVQLFSQAQLVAEEMVEDVSRDAQERLGHAREHERKIVEEAVNTAGEQVRSYARTARAQMASVMESFASEVDRLGSPALARDQRTNQTPRPSDPLFDDLGSWQISLRDTDGPDSSGTA
jgi:cell division septum initiation protein DivIVA